jgi:hypothetical protein
MACSLTPSVRQTSTAGVPASAWRRAWTSCSSGNRLFFPASVLLLPVVRSRKSSPCGWTNIRGAGQAHAILWWSHRRPDELLRRSIAERAVGSREMGFLENLHKVAASFKSTNYGESLDSLCAVVRQLPSAPHPPPGTAAQSVLPVPNTGSCLRSSPVFSNDHWRSNLGYADCCVKRNDG